MNGAFRLEAVLGKLERPLGAMRTGCCTRRNWRKGALPPAMRAANIAYLRLFGNLGIELPVGAAEDDVRQLVQRGKQRPATQTPTTERVRLRSTPIRTSRHRRDTSVSPNAATKGKINASYFRSKTLASTL
jgi:hypothetical protein